MEKFISLNSRSLFYLKVVNYAKFQVIPAVSISYVVYETVRKRLGANMS